jgi:hypothetical protein
LHLKAAMSLFGNLFAPSVSPEAVRAEIWSLGARHYGEPLDGALRELAAPSLDPARAGLLRACVRQLRDA